MKHVIVHKRPGMFYGWPANNGVWSWGDEIAVGFTEAHYLEKHKGHSQDESKPSTSVIARSTDGGKSWRLERPGNYPEGYAFGEEARPEGLTGSGLEEPLDFTNPDIAIRGRNGHFFVSSDRCRTWHGPYFFPKFDFESAYTARTDYLPLEKNSCLFFVSVKDQQVRSGSFNDRAFCIRTDDGGRTFKRLGFMLPENPEVRSVMSQTVRVGVNTLVSVLRRRYDGNENGYKACWIDAAVSDNLGETWRFLSKVADTHARGSEHNGNPPSLVKLADGRLCAVYGYRAPVFGMMAKISENDGKTWGGEIVLRDDARTWDFGYPRSVVRPDGKVVSIYYYTTQEDREQHIAATIWDPDRIKA